MRDEFYREPRRIRVDPVDLITAFARAFVELADRRADTADARAFVELVAAQARGEMADDAATPEDDDACFNYNLTGNKRPVGGPALGGDGPVPWTTLGTHELVSNAEADRLIAAGLAEEQRHPHDAPAGKRAVYFKNLGPDRSHVATHFRAFDSLDEGALFSLSRYLDPGSRYATGAIQAALFRGDPGDFAFELKAKGYYSATYAQYRTLVAGQLVKVKRDAARVDWPALPIMSAARARKVAEQGALGLWGAVRASQGTSLADLERARRERDGEGGSDDVSLLRRRQLVGLPVVPRRPERGVAGRGRAG